MLQVLQEEETTSLDQSKVYDTAMDGSEDAIQTFLNTQQASRMWSNVIIVLSNVFYWKSNAKWSRISELRFEWLPSKYSEMIWTQGKVRR